MSRDNKKAAGGGLRLFYRFRDNALSFYNLVRTRAAGIGHGDEVCAAGGIFANHKDLRPVCFSVSSRCDICKYSGNLRKNVHCL